MTTWFISRHPGAIAWAAQQGIKVDRQIAHLEPGQIMTGDIVIGTLPVNLAAAVCSVGAQYINLSVDVPADLRGQELSLEQMLTYHARLESFDILQKPIMLEHKILEESRHIIANLPLIQISIRARSLGMQTPQNIGSAWHGAFGKILHDTQPSCYAALYGNKLDGEDTHIDVKPYVLRPPQPDIDFSSGTNFSFSIILMGQGVEYVDQIKTAIHQLGEQGVGPGLGQFEVQHIECKPIQLQGTTNQECDITLHFLSATLLKEGNLHIKTAPSMALLIKRVLNRTDQFLRQLDTSLEIPAQLKKHLVQQADQVALSQHEIEWLTQPRYSARQKAWMPFGGISGTVQFSRLPASLMLWLELAQWLHVGNKTTFGQGRIGVICHS
jgi:CRISPR-associated protein Csx16